MSGIGYHSEAIDELDRIVDWFRDEIVKCAEEHAENDRSAITVERVRDAATAVLEELKYQREVHGIEARLRDAIDSAFAENDGIAFQPDDQATHIEEILVKHIMPLIGDKLIEAEIAGAKAKLALAVTKLQEATMWIEEHLRLS